MCQKMTEAKKIAKNQDVVDAAKTFNIEALKLGQMIVGIGLNPAQKREINTAVTNAGGNRRLATLKQTYA